MHNPDNALQLAFVSKFRIMNLFKGGFNSKNGKEFISDETYVQDCCIGDKINGL